jgi:hypothetical protein
MTSKMQYKAKIFANTTILNKAEVQIRAGLEIFHEIGIETNVI